MVWGELNKRSYWSFGLFLTKNYSAAVLVHRNTPLPTFHPSDQRAFVVSELELHKALDAMET